VQQLLSLGDYLRPVSRTGHSSTLHTAAGCPPVFNTLHQCCRVCCCQPYDWWDWRLGL